MTRWAVISDEHTQPRASCLLAVAHRLRAQGVSIGGFIQRRTAAADGPGGFELLRLSDEGQRVVLAQKPVKDGLPADDAACDYVFEERVFRTARTWVEEDVRVCDLVVLDVISKMETYGHGHAASLKVALEAPHPALVLIGVRSSQLDAIVNAFALDLDSVVSWLELPAASADHERFVSELIQAASRSPSP